ncbi:MAG: twin-arginine translocation signal domain-containing protein, partial [Deltaproteobacteria bacterium]|nr:twin-arginine translocation signal domain-containing protein [Deltaproteobacteria bacterium]
MQRITINKGECMKVNRREFIRITGAATAGLAVSGLGFDLR